MKSPVQTAPQPTTLSDVASSTALSEVVESWEHEATAQDFATQFRSENLSEFKSLSSKKVDHSKIDKSVVLAHQLSRHEEKNLHFFIQRYRLLCNRVLEVARHLQSQVFLITSALADEGKTLTSANLAFALSGIERKRTLLIDLDLRRYALHSLLGIQSNRSDQLFLEAADWHECLWSLRPNLDALLSTAPADQPDQLLHSSALHNLLNAAREEYDYILIDSAPLLLAADTHALLPVIDHALLVVRADYTPIACSQDALKILGDKVAGCILNDVKRLKYESYYHGYYGTDKQ
jgi:capsular exopolysaccharide synthesis family protein